jgi:diaminohydroxyphosphoribosylaminopyrimidine deaminase / 5-amino-6-(5-phosphoribosylamino)uracil reductase
MGATTEHDLKYIRLALRLARRGYGRTSPNPMVGAVLVKNGQLLGQGWHKGAGQPHAEIEAMREAESSGASLRGATLYVTLEPCSTTGRTPPCTESIISRGIARVVAATIDPNPSHSGAGFRLLKHAGIEVVTGLLQERAELLNEAFNHWIVHKTPFVTVKAALSLDGKIATSSGESRWITSDKARAFSMMLRAGTDAILVGINTLLADNPKLTVRKGGLDTGRKLRRIILDPQARTPSTAHVVADEHPDWTTIVVTDAAPQPRVAALAQRVNVLAAPSTNGRIHLNWLLQHFGNQSVTSLLVEGGGETNAAFLLDGLAQRILFVYAPKIIGGRSSPQAVAGQGVEQLADALQVRQQQWRRLGPDLLLTARVGSPQFPPHHL